jgi:uncharacterized protein involved in cysteine biosynthesis
MDYLGNFEFSCVSMAYITFVYTLIWTRMDAYISNLSIIDWIVGLSACLSILALLNNLGMHIFFFSAFSGACLGIYFRGLISLAVGWNQTVENIQDGIIDQHQ